MLFDRSRKTIFQVAFSIALIPGLAGNANGNPPKEVQLRTISITPYGIHEQGHSSGIYYDLANTFAKESGYSAINHVYPYVRIIHELKSGQADLTIMFKYEELDEHVIYIAPLPSLKNVVIGLRGTKINAINDLKYKKLAYLRGARFSDVIDSDITIEKLHTVDFNQGIKMLKGGRVSAVIGPLEALLKAADANDLSSSEFGRPLVVSQRTPWVQISKKSQSRVNIKTLTKQVETILKRGDLKQLRLKYLPQNYPMDSPLI